VLPPESSGSPAVSTFLAHSKDRRIAEIEKRSARLEEKLMLAEKLIDLKKVSAILGINLTNDEER
jgi:hypothetical protein